MDKVFVEKETYDFEKITNQIEGFSDVFEIDYTLDLNNTAISQKEFEKNSFFNPVEYFEIAKEYSTYVIFEDLLFKTSNDIISDKMQQLEANILVFDKDSDTYQKKYNDFEYDDHISNCKLVAKLNRNK